MKIKILTRKSYRKYRIKCLFLEADYQCVCRCQLMISPEFKSFLFERTRLAIKPNSAILFNFLLLPI